MWLSQLWSDHDNSSDSSDDNNHDSSDDNNHNDLTQRLAVAAMVIWQWWQWQQHSGSNDDTMVAATI